MDQKNVFIIILGMTVVTYLPRLLPVLFLSSRSLPPILAAWLRYIPVSVMAAMVMPTLVLQDQQIAIGRDNIFFWAAFPTLLVAWKTKSLFGSVVVGMVVVAAARNFGLY
jgi:branched-subunit amino acid transport protein